MALAIGTVVFAVITVTFAIAYTKLLKDVLVEEFNKKKGE